MLPMRSTTALLAASLVLLAAGCATLQDPQRSNLSAGGEAVAGCAAWYRALDELTDKAGVRDAGEHRVAGFPYLRVDRFSASFRTQAQDSEEAFRTWTARMQVLDEQARRVELQNLPDTAIDALGVDRAQAVGKTRACAATLADLDLDSPERRNLLNQRAQVPDDYLTWQRALGLYPLTRLPFSLGVENWHEETVKEFRNTHEFWPRLEAVSRYVPSGSPDRDRAKQIVAQARTDALGVPEFSDGEIELLFDAFAPVFEVEADGDFDRIGALEWGDGPAPVVDRSRPLVYRKLAYTRYRGETLAQLVYVAWFSERPRKRAFDLLAGRLDGIVWRVTLGRQGEPLVYDSIHPCGCFHMFFPTPGVQTIPGPGKLTEWAFVPADAPQLATGERVVLRLATRTHYLVGIAVDAGGAGEQYTFAEYDTLRTIPLAGGGSRSAFAPNGLVPGTERGERVFFWPMGVPSAGAMRQWGRHATAFLGRRHFDDADLIERRFRVGPEQDRAGL